MHSNNPHTAAPEQSIWRDTSHDLFRQHLLELEQCTNAVPVGPQVFTLPQDDSARQGRCLPLSTEQQTADDFAFLVAVGEGAQSVAAVCLEENATRNGLNVVIAGVDLQDDIACSSLSAFFHLLSQSSTSHEESSLLIEKLFSLVIDTHYIRILNRLRSAKWNKPTYLSRTHKKPLWQDFPNLVHRVQLIYAAKRDRELCRELETHLTNLGKTYEEFELDTPSPGVDRLKLQQLVISTYNFCLIPSVRVYASRLFNHSKPTDQISAAIKTLRQLEKIASYWRICQDLIHTSQTYSYLFQSITLKYLPPYSSIPTEIAYESWAKTCHVHAEVNMVHHYDLKFSSLPSHNTASSHVNSDSSDKSTNSHHSHTRSNSILKSRIIGTSKHHCYLCHLFLKHHPAKWPVPNTHGRLYDQWTIPDTGSSDNTNLTHQYRSIIKKMDEEITTLTRVIRSEHNNHNRDGESEVDVNKEKDEVEADRDAVDENKNDNRTRLNPKSKTNRPATKIKRVEPMTSRENLLMNPRFDGFKSI